MSNEGHGLYANIRLGDLRASSNTAIIAILLDIVGREVGNEKCTVKDWLSLLHNFRWTRFVGDDSKTHQLKILLWSDQTQQGTNDIEECLQVIEEECGMSAGKDGPLALEWILGPETFHQTTLGGLS